MSIYYNIKYNTLPQQVEENRKKIADLELYIEGNLLDPEIFVLVSELPEVGLPNKIYLVPKPAPELNDGYDEFIWKDETWELLGSLTLDLSGYYNKGEVDGLLSAKVNANNPITAGTKAKITYDEKGLVTGGADLANEDIPTLPASKITQSTTARFVTDTEKSTWNLKQNALTAGDGISISGNVISADSGLTVEEWNTTTKTLALSDANKLFVCVSAENRTLTVPTNASVPLPIGTMITFLLIGPDKVTFVGASGVNILSMDSLVELATPHGMASLIKIFENTWQLVGAL